ncbi:MAG: DUF6141 family protein [Chloroflexota bacterium]|nr:DUF6141 family protein [Chloroflexota bacterium]
MAPYDFEVSYHEDQKFTQWWIWLLVYGISALMWWGFVEQIILGKPWGSKPAPDWMMWLLWLFIGIGLPLLFHRLKLVTEVSENSLHIRYPPITSRDIPLADIQSFEARSYDPIREYGGWGIRGWRGSGVAYTTSGNQGVELTLQDGKSVMVGSQRAEELAAALETRIPGARKA